MWTCRHRALFALILFALVSISSQAATLNSIRFGTHEEFDRVVFDLSSESFYEIKSLPSGVLELYLRDTDVSEKFFLPKLPANMKALTLVEAFRENERDVVIEIRGKMPLTAKDIVLQGQSWRLALDISGQQTEASPAQKVVPKKQEDSRPYIPGDKPIETKFADEKIKNATPSEAHPVQEEKRVTQSLKREKPKAEPAKVKAAQKSDAKPPESPKLAPTRTESEEARFLAWLKTPPAITEPVDTLKALDVLANFYAEMGDTQSVTQFESLIAVKEQAETPVRHLAKGATPNDTEPRMADWLIVVLAIVGGLAGGVLGTRLSQSSKPIKFSMRLPRMPKLPKLGKKKTQAKQESEPEAKELKRHSDDLDKAVQREKKAAKKEAPAEVVKEAESAFPADEPAAEVMMKESLMDRRVKRVLELSAQKRDIAEIAKELDMGQDEVKLILDLNS